VIAVATDGGQTLRSLDTTRRLAAPRDLALQFARLDGAVIVVRGAIGARGVRVRSYELVDAGDGLSPLVGTIVVDQSGVGIDEEITGTRLALRGTTLEELKPLHACRVWVTGSVVGPQILLVAHWGLLLRADEVP